MISKIFSELKVIKLAFKRVLPSNYLKRYLLRDVHVIVGKRSENPWDYWKGRAGLAE